MDIRIKEKLEILGEKLSVLTKEKEALRKEIQFYQLENRELKDRLSEMKPAGKNFPELPESRIIANENGRYAAKIASISKEIDVYVQEIDRCIAQLES